MHQTLIDFYSIILSLESLLNTQIKLLGRCMDTDSMHINNRQQIQDECKDYKQIYEPIISRPQKVLELPLEIFQHQLSSHKTLCQQLTESAFQEFQTALTKEVDHNKGFLNDLNKTVKNLPIEDFGQKSDEGDELVWDEWDGLDELDENKWNNMSELGDLGGSCEFDDFDESGKSGELGEVSGIRVEKLVETLALGRYLVN